MPTPYSGFMGMRAGLIHDTYIDSFQVKREKKSFKHIEVSEEMQEEIQKEAGGDMYSKLA